jgi:DNA-binding NarL/FixJ family response regulator
MPKPLDPKAAGSPRKILMVDDHPVLRQALAKLIKAEPGIELCGSFGTAAEAMPSIAASNPDLVLVGQTLPEKRGLELIKHIRKTNKKVKLLVVSMHEETIFANQVLRLGADGYIMKPEDPDEIIHAIRDVLNGHIYISEEILAGPSAKNGRLPAGRAKHLQDNLSNSELKILGLLGQGKTSVEIARQLRSSTRRVNQSCREIKRKLRLKNQNALIRYAVCWVEK